MIRVSIFFLTLALLLGSILSPSIVALASPPALPGTWSATGDMNVGRVGHTATLLTNGMVLVTGGIRGTDVPGLVTTLKSSELYDPKTGLWSFTGDLNFARAFHNATLLPNGKVLATGGRDEEGIGFSILQSCELYDPKTGTWSTVGDFASFIGENHTATLLSGGKVLVTGGDSYLIGQTTNACNQFDLKTGTWSVFTSMNFAHEKHTATLLPRGKVLIAGGDHRSLPDHSELYDPATGLWSETGSMSTSRINHTATLLANNKVLVTGGEQSAVYGMNSSELYDPKTGTWSATGNLNFARAVHTDTLLSDGTVLVAGGRGDTGVMNSCELYTPPKK